MNSLQSFNKNFGIGANINEEENKFVQRINQTVFYTLQKNYYKNGYKDLFISICYRLGINGLEMVDKLNRRNFSDSIRVPDIINITRNDYMETLKVLVLLYNDSSKEQKISISSSIELALSQSAIDLGIRWKDGMFYPSGAKELDEKLINDNLEWLEKYPETRTMYSAALSRFNISLTDPSARKDAITNAYSAIESLSRVLLNNKKNFEANSNEVVDKLGLPKEYKSIVHYYKQIAHEYSSRHAGSEFSHEEAEAFIYMTGILIRLIINKI